MTQELLREYYNYLYPFHTLVRWLTYNQDSKLSHRQLSFEFQEVGVERYVTFVDADGMKSRMIDRHSKVPLKVDAGAIWNVIPKKDTPGKTIERELVFDFDMNDYDDVRTCCSGKNVCVKCWKMLIIAVQIIEKAMEEDFGFTKLMYVFSGGRGLHIWICDKRARELKDNVRKGLVDYLQLVTGNVKAISLLSDKVITPVDDVKHLRNKLKDDNATRQQLIQAYLKYNTSSHVERSFQIIRKYFQEILKEQQIFEHEKCIELMQKIIGQRNEKLKDNIKNLWKKAKSTDFNSMFSIMRKEIDKYQRSMYVNDYVQGKEPDQKIHRLTLIQEQIMLSFLYPRMDYHVSTMQNHLLKLPFSVHPTSKKISIPLFKRDVYNFDPKKCVTILQLLKALQELRQANLIQDTVNEVIAKKTLLGPPIEAMEEFIASLD